MLLTKGELAEPQEPCHDEQRGPPSRSRSRSLALSLSRALCLSPEEACVGEERGLDSSISSTVGVCECGYRCRSGCGREREREKVVLMHVASVLLSLRLFFSFCLSRSPSLAHTRTLSLFPPTHYHARAQLS